jgi:glycine/D-amino acid oxidase-like deaminating enzyme
MIITRYIAAPDRDTPVVNTDFLIVGGGIAGLFTALKAAAYGSVVVLTKKTIAESNTGLAQGGLPLRCMKKTPPFCILRILWRQEPVFALLRQLMYWFAKDRPGSGN